VDSEERQKLGTVQSAENEIVNKF